MSTIEKSELNQLEVSFIDSVVSENLIENLGSISEALMMRHEVEKHTNVKTQAEALEMLQHPHLVKALQLT
jgi:hypothetical protein